MKELKIYLAGKMSGLTFFEMNRWRVVMKEQLTIAASDICNVRIINPTDYYNFENIRHKSEEEVMDYDLDHVKSSDILIINLDKVQTSPGTIVEIHTAWELGIPVLAFGNNDALHPWIKRMIRRTDDTLEELVDYIKDFYFV